MDEQQRAHIATQHGFPDWAEPDPQSGTAAGVRPDQLVPAGWRLLRVDTLPLPAARAASRSLWESETRADAMLRLDLLEMPDLAAARAMLLELLGEFQSPQVARAPDFGEVGFAQPGGGSILFARGNVVAWLRNSGRDVLDLGEVAAAVDRALAGLIRR